MEILYGMNHAEGDCPLCLYPLFSEIIDLHLHPFNNIYKMIIKFIIIFLYFSEYYNKLN
jgi:hypothetical protein